MPEMPAWFRETAAGKALRFFSGNQLLQYPEEKADFELPAEWRHVVEEKTRSSSTSASASRDSVSEQIRPSAISDARDEGNQREKSVSGSTPVTTEEEGDGIMPRLTKTKSIPIAPRRTSDGHILVGW